MGAYLVLFLFLLIALTVALLVPNVNLITNKFLKIDRTNREKFEPYECGIPRIQPLKGSYFAFFYILALVFLLFDLETVFLFPWAVAFRELGVLGIVEAFVFVAILLVGFLYAVVKGALKWD
ncbi:NADH-quinone oxidoreductase subunit A [Thermovibrio ammonificans]|uniref:NADH-quinone oxidoreductase subunit A n=1 Tax=Thermovibrio ammonificans (strain DSM 15698 / JCM 12110 / HB-1) TaxID=648996 RepID=E8T6B4_THEA1|nr:NADH-quinone oxidoreductase subunit A [Thermovibrio ammonificans]ADU96698.1 NADH-ubiquinone/plastoquinone oxidoreductase chain 3 [Thermovibrio ammonificans HB-1]